MTDHSESVRKRGLNTTSTRAHLHVDRGGCIEAVHNVSKMPVLLGHAWACTR